MQMLQGFMILFQYILITTSTLCAKIVFIHKQDRADLEMFYFYNKESEAKINKFITDNKVMIKFKDY